MESVYVRVCMCVSVYVECVYVRERVCFNSVDLSAIPFFCIVRQGNFGFVSAAEVGLFLKANLYLSCCLLVKSHTVSSNLSRHFLTPCEMRMKLCF